MIYQNVELHNVAEIIERKDGGVALQRVPESLRPYLNDSAKLKVLQPASGEIRFAVDRGAPATVTLTAVPHENRGSETTVSIFFGDYLHEVRTIGPDPEPIEIAWNEPILACFDEVMALPHTFAPNVIRLMSRGAQVAFHSATADGIRPPRADQLPAIRYLSYGTSITHGARASVPHLTYAAQTARRLGADLLNFGVGGACHCEPEFADYFASRDDWDIATLSLSVNMMSFEPDEFEKRVRYVVHTVAASHPDRPVACITIFPFAGDLASRGKELNQKVAQFRQILRDASADCPTGNTHLIEGPELLQDFTGLTTDLIHPADDGMIEMGLNLSARLRELL